MGISPEDSGKLKQQGKRMSDVATANFLVEQIGGKRRVNEMLHSAWRELSKRFPHKQDPENQWTERRLRGWWNNESQIVKYFQMMELYETAEQLRKARDQHAEFIEKTNRIRTLAKLVASNEIGRDA
jgi:uncharacterized coiled-coil DUF342 family protein